MDKRRYLDIAEISVAVHILPPQVDTAQHPYSGSERWSNKLTFSGAAVFEVDKNGFKLKGKIDHSDGGRASDRDYWRGYQYYDNTVKRGLYIDDVLYTFSNKYLKMNKLDDLELVKKLELKKSRGEAGDDFEVVN